MSVNFMSVNSPCFANNYNVDFELYGITSIEEDQKPIYSLERPEWFYEEDSVYVPPCECNLIDIFERKKTIGGNELFALLPKEIFDHVYSLLDREGLYKISQLNSYYFLTIEKIYTIPYLKSFFSNVQKPEASPIFTELQQFKIVYKRARDIQGRFVKQICHLEEVQKIFTEQHFQSYRTDAPGKVNYTLHIDLRLKSMDVTVRSVFLSSEIQSCKVALELIPKDFDNENNFEEIMQEIETNLDKYRLEDLQREQGKLVAQVNKPHTYTIQKDVGFGNSILLCGEGGDLSWDPALGQPLECVGSAEWKAEVPGCVKEFKFVVKYADGTYQWEPGPNRTLHSHTISL